MRVQVLVLSVLVLVVACDGQPESVPADPVHDQPIAGELPCDEAIDTDAEVPGGYEIILDAVALPTARTARRALQAFPDDASPPTHFGKTGLLVRAGEEFALEVTQPDTDAIGWGAPAVFGPRITTEGCDGDGWVAFPGGFQVQQPTCLGLTVSAHGEQASVLIGVGAPCEGQLPPVRVPGSH